MKRSPVSSTTRTAAATNAIRAASQYQPPGTCSTASWTISAGLNGSSHLCVVLSFYHRIESTANSTVPSKTPGGYHQLLTPKTSGSRPAEMAGAMGEFSTRITATAPATISNTEGYPYGSARVTTMPMAPVKTG